MNRRFAGVCLAAFWLGQSAPALSAEAPVPAASLHDQAIALYRAKQYRQAVPLYRRLAEQSPDNPEILLDLVWTLWYAEHYEEAADIAGRYLALRPEDAPVWALLGRTRYLTGHREEALRAFQKSLALDPDQGNLMLDMARTQVALRNYSEAIQSLLALRAKQPDLLDALPDLARSQSLAGMFVESAANWSKAAEAFPAKRAEYLFQQAQALYFAGKRTQALSLIRHLLVWTPHYRLAVNFLVDAALARGDWPSAARILEQDLSEPTPQDGPRLLRLASIYQTHLDYEAATRILEKLLEDNPHDGQGLLMAADCMKEQRNFGDAKTRYEKVLRENPWSFRALKSLADLYFVQGKNDQALSCIRKARAMDPTDPYMLFLESNYLYAVGKKPESEALLSQWLKANPGPSLPVLLYHGLTPYRDDPILAYPIHTPVSAFDDQMRGLQTAGFHPITAEEAQAWLEGKFELPSRPILITFDDARLDSFRYGDPVLKKYGLRATMMVALANILRNLSGFTSWSQLQFYQRTGRWEMQAHGNLGHSKVPLDEEGHVALFMPNKIWLEKSHRLESTDEWEARIVRDMKETTDAIERNLGKAPVAFAFPEGDYGQEDINNFVDSPALIMKHSRELYGSLYHQDGYGFNVRTKDPSFLCRIEVDPRWKGKDLVRHLTDRDPVIVAKRLFLWQATWDQKTHEANELLREIKKAGASPAVVFADEARIRSTTGDRLGAWDLAVRALAYDPLDKDNQYLVQSLQEKKSYAWTPRFEYFSDNKNRRNWLFHQQVDTLRTGNTRYTLSHLHGFFSESGFANVADDGLGVGVGRPLGLYHFVAAEAGGHFFSGATENTFSVDGSVHSRWADHFESDLSAGRAPYPTAQALDANIVEQHLKLKTLWSPESLWRTLTQVEVQNYSDHNRRYEGSLEISRAFLKDSPWRGVYRLTADNTDTVSPSYYSPQSLQLHQLGIAYEKEVRQVIKAQVRYLPGFGDEKAAHDSFVQVADLDFLIYGIKTFSIQPAISFTSTPSYNSTTYSLAITKQF